MTLKLYKKWHYLKAIHKYGSLLFRTNRWCKTNSAWRLCFTAHGNVPLATCKKFTKVTSLKTYFLRVCAQRLGHSTDIQAYTMNALQNICALLGNHCPVLYIAHMETFWQTASHGSSKTLNSTQVCSLAMTSNCMRSCKPKFRSFSNQCRDITSINLFQIKLSLQPSGTFIIPQQR